MKTPNAFSVLISCAALLAASNTRALTFEDALKAASQNSHDLKELRLQAESVSLNQRRAMAGFLPKLDIDARHLFSERFEELEVPFAGSVFVMPAIQPYSSLGVTATINIFNGFADSNNVLAARLENVAAGERVQRAEEKKRAEVRTLFYRAIGSQILVDVADQNIQTLQGHLNDVGSRVRSGVSTRYDSLRVEVQLEDAKTEKYAAEGHVVIDRARLFETLGISDDGKPLEGKMPDSFGNVNVEKAALESSTRIDRAALMAERDRSMHLSSSSRGHWMPKVSLFGNYEWYDNLNHAITTDEERFKSAYALGIQASWNIFDGGADLASQRQAALASEIAKEHLAQFDQALPVALEESKRRFSYDVINFNAKLSSIRKAEEAVRLAKGGVKAGTLTNTDVLDAVVDLNRAKAAAVKSQIDAIEALGQLELSVGHPLL